MGKAINSCPPAATYLSLLFSYKAAGATVVDLTGAKDTAEFINVSKDDALAYPRIVHVAYPPTVNARIQNAVKPFVEACMEANDVVLEVFTRKLGLPEGALARRHSLEEHSVSEARCIRVPPSPGSTKIAVGAHTDFGRSVPASASDLARLGTDSACHAVSLSWLTDWVDCRLCFLEKRVGNTSKLWQLLSVRSTLISPGV